MAAKWLMHSDVFLSIKLQASPKGKDTTIKLDKVTYHFLLSFFKE